MTYSNHTPGLKARLTHMALAATGAATVLTIGLSAVTAMPASARDDAVETALRLRLPKTPVDALACDTLGPWCEVVSGDTLFYIDKAARYLFVGRLYDMEQRSDLTAARLLELNPDLIAAGGARAQGGDSEAAKGKPQSPEHVDLSSLPAEGAIRWGNPDGPKLVIFSDFQCSYCKRLSGELAKAGVLVEERPISIFGKESRDLSEAVTCADDPVAALHEAYEGRDVMQGTKAQHKCPGVSGLDANEAFARANGFAGTPVIVRASDGAVLHGYRDADTLRAFAAGGKEQRK